MPFNRVLSIMLSMLAFKIKLEKVYSQQFCPRPRNLYAHIVRLYARWMQGGHIIEQAKFKADQYVRVNMSAICSDQSQTIEIGTSELVFWCTQL